MLPTTIYQRTEAGRDEIRQKQGGLTQSERQVLIMVDGVARYQEVRGKLSALTNERFDRAVHTLLKKDLISEVFLPVAGQKAEQIETAVAERFLQQEPTDPVTIISYDPEEDFGEFLAQSADALAAPIPELDVIVAPVPAVDEVHARLADALQEELQARQAERRNLIAPSQNPSAPSTPAPAPHAVFQMQPPDRTRIHWGYWLIGLGITFIVGFLIARFTAH